MLVRTAGARNLVHVHPTSTRDHCALPYSRAWTLVRRSISYQELFSPLGLHLRLLQPTAVRGTLYIVYMSATFHPLHVLMSCQEMRWRWPLSSGEMWMCDGVKYVGRALWRVVQYECVKHIGGPLVYGEILLRHPRVIIHIFIHTSHLEVLPHPAPFRSMASCLRAGARQRRSASSRGNP